MDKGSSSYVNKTAVGSLSVLLTGIIFLFDLSTPPGRAEWLLYLLPLLLSSSVFGRRGIFLYAFAQSIFIAAGYLFSSNGAYSDIAVFNRILITATIWVVAFYTASRQIALTQLERARVELENRVEERTAELRTANLSLIEEAEHRKLLEQEKTDFLAMVSHDMKSPLTVISGYADLLMMDKSKSLDTDTLLMFEGIDSSSKRLLRLVEDFVSLTKIESGRLHPQKRSEAVGAALKDTANAYSLIADKKGLEYSSTLPDGSVTAELDWGLIQRAVSNLLENAMNYTPSGGRVALTAYRDAGGLVVEVADTGPGIALEEAQQVFEKYYRSATTSHVKGTGLGLAIVKAIVEAHGGRVELDTEPGRGSTFRLVLPQ